MEITTAENLAGVDGGAGVVITYFSDGDDDRLSEAAVLNLPGFSQAQTRGELKGGLFKVSIFRGSPTVALVGLGNSNDFSDVRWRRAIEAGVRTLTRAGFTDLGVSVSTRLAGGRAAAACVDATVRGAYDPGLLKTPERETFDITKLTIVGHEVESGAFDTARIVAESANVSRELLNMPPSDLDPVVFADELVKIGKEANVSVDVLDQKAIEKMKMGAILAVSAGSDKPPRVIKLTYGDPESPVRLALVGKGLTYDAGGLSLKTHAGLEWMKGDMGGAAAVAGAMRAIGLLQPKGIHVTGLIGAVENMLGPGAMKPGDVLRTMKGKTIEVLNTDAEGRLVLSDLLAYAVELGSTHIVDLATLTGSAVIALGAEACALVGKPQVWADRVKNSAETAGERMWQLPLYPEYRRQIASDVADMKNVGGREGGALTASALLAEFVDEVPWVHLDIAGTAWQEKETADHASGGTGFGVATLVQLVHDLAR